MRNSDTFPVGCDKLAQSPSAHEETCRRAQAHQSTDRAAGKPGRTVMVVCLRCRHHRAAGSSPPASLSHPTATTYCTNRARPLRLESCNIARSEMSAKGEGYVESAPAASRGCVGDLAGRRACGRSHRLVFEHVRVAGNLLYLGDEVFRWTASGGSSLWVPERREPACHKAWRLPSAVPRWPRNNWSAG